MPTSRFLSRWMLMFVLATIVVACGDDDKAAAGAASSEDPDDRSEPSEPVSMDAAMPAAIQDTGVHDASKAPTIDTGDAAPRDASKASADAAIDAAAPIDAAATSDAGGPMDATIPPAVDAELPPLDPPPLGGWASIDSGLPKFAPRPPGAGGQGDLYNREAVVPPQCYTRTEGVHNPCYVCHQDPTEGIGHENRMGDGELQGDYGFSDTALTNHWRNLFVDRSAEVAAISDETIDAYIAEDNYTPLTPRLVKSGFQGWIPDLWGLQEGARAFDAQGFARDDSGWVAFNYKPMPSTFWPTNGATDDVMIRLPLKFRSDAAGEPSRDVYMANLAIVEAAIKGMAEISCPPIDETRVGSDLDGDGKLGTATRVVRPEQYVGGARDETVNTFLYPRYTSFLHTVRYVGVAPDGRIVPSRRMKEVRYMTKPILYRKSTLGAFYDEERQEKIEGNLPVYADLKDKGLRNSFGWVVQGFIEDADGHLRPNTYEETFFCMGCHSTIGSTIDKTFAFARKVDGAAGWGYIDLTGMPDAPNLGETDGEILTYLKRVGGGAEFRNNPEMAARWFDGTGAVKDAEVRAADVYTLIAPSPERARQLNKAYRVIVQQQGYLRGRDATVTSPVNVFDVVDPAVVPLLRDYRYRWDIRLAWP